MTIGYTAAGKGELTISATRMDLPVMLRDNLTGITHDLAQGGYTFQPEAATCDSRFTLTFDGTLTAIKAADRDAETGTARYDLQGRRVANSRQTVSGQIDIVTDGHTAKKVIRK